MSLIAISGKIGSGKDTVAKIIQFLTVQKSMPEGWVYNNDPLKWHDAVEDTFEHEWETHRFADEIKDTVCRWIGCTREKLEDREFKEKPLGEEWNKWGVSYNCPTDEIEKVFATQKEATEYAKKLGATGKSLTHLNIVQKIVMTPRKLMQLLGTDAGRQIIHPDLWVNSRFATYDPDTNKWIIPDTRFPNEVGRVDEYGGLTIRVERDIDNRFPDLWSKFLKETDYNGRERNFYKWLKDFDQDFYDKLTHKSETALDDYEDWDVVIYNNFSIQTLLEITTEILKEKEII